MRKLILLILVINLIGLAYAQTVWPSTSSLQNNLTSYYTMNEGSGSFVSNSKTPSIPGQAYGSPQWVIGKSSYALNFTNNSDQKVVLNNSFTLPSGAKSISAWVYPRNNNGNYEGIVHTGTSAVCQTFSIVWRNQQFGIQGNTAGCDMVSVPGTSSLNAWHHVVAVQENATKRLIYVDGINLANLSTTSFAFTMSSENQTIGNNGLNSQPFSGIIDEVAFWNKSLNSSEVLELYNNSYYQVSSLNLFSPAYGDTILNNKNTLFNCTVDSSVPNIQNVTLIINGVVNSTMTGPSYSNNIMMNVGHNSVNNYTCIARNTSNYLINTTLVNNFNVVHYILNSVSYSSNVTELSTTDFDMNLSYDQSYTAGVYLIYNGTTYSTTRSGSGNDYIFNYEKEIATITSQVNYSFYFLVSLTNSSSSLNFNSSTYNQSIYKINLDDCTSYSNLLINYTIYDEATKVKLNPTAVNTSLEAIVKLGNPTLTNYIIYSFNKSRVNSIHVCSQTNLSASNLRLDQTAKYTGIDRATEYLVTQNKTVNLTYIPLRLDLFLLNSSDATRFVITYKDSAFITTPGVVIEINRQYISENNFTLVEAPETDQQGKTIGNFVLNNVIYNIYVKKNGQILAVFEGLRLYCATSECTLNINQPSSTTLIDNLVYQYGLIFTKSYSALTRTYTLAFSSIDGNSKAVNLTGTLYNNAMNLTLCNSYANSLSNSLDCVIPSQYSNVTILFTSTVNGRQLTNELIQVTNRGVSDNIKYILAFFVVLTLVALGASTGKGAMTMIFGMLGFVFVGTLYLVDYRGFIGVASAITWLIIAAAIILIKIVGGKHDE